MSRRQPLELSDSDLEAIASHAAISLMAAPPSARNDLFQEWIEPLDLGQTFTVAALVIGAALDSIDGIVRAPGMQARHDQNLAAARQVIAPLPAGYPVPRPA